MNRAVWTQDAAVPTLVESVDKRRVLALAELDVDRRKRLGQFMTPAPIARFMASLIRSDGRPLRILDPGAGVGSLLAAVVDELCDRGLRPAEVELTAVEIDPILRNHLDHTIAEVEQRCAEAAIPCSAESLVCDFIDFARNALDTQLSFNADVRPGYDLVVLNPPYRKIRTSSTERKTLRRLGIETTNLYSAFLAISALLLNERGQLVAITPRSFCNGPYFRAFRRLFLGHMAFTRVHVIESRGEAFADDGVLQENIIFHAVRGRKPDSVVVTSGGALEDSGRFGREVEYDHFVSPGDTDLFIHLAPEPMARDVAAVMRGLPCTLPEIGLSVSTGRVVDFRAREFLRANPIPSTVPLIYPTHFAAGFVNWPKHGKKPNAIVVAPETSDLLVPWGTYVLVKRFSAKEELRRVVAAVYDPARLAFHPVVGFENHLNYYHENGRGVDPFVARGLTAFLNSSIVDRFFRQFSGHTQVNAGDLRKLRYPSRNALRQLGAGLDGSFPAQSQLDDLVETSLMKESRIG